MKIVKPLEHLISKTSSAIRTMGKNTLDLSTYPVSVGGVILCSLFPGNANAQTSVTLQDSGSPSTNVSNLISTIQASTNTLEIYLEPQELDLPGIDSINLNYGSTTTTLISTSGNPVTSGTVNGNSPTTGVFFRDEVDIPENMTFRYIIFQETNNSLAPTQFAEIKRPNITFDCCYFEGNENPGQRAITITIAGGGAAEGFLTSGSAILDFEAGMEANNPDNPGTVRGTIFTSNTASILGVDYIDLGRLDDPGRNVFRDETYLLIPQFASPRNSLHGAPANEAFDLELNYFYNPDNGNLLTDIDDVIARIQDNRLGSKSRHNVLNLADDINVSLITSHHPFFPGENSTEAFTSVNSVYWMHYDSDKKLYLPSVVKESQVGVFKYNQQTNTIESMGNAKIIELSPKKELYLPPQN